MGWLIDTNIWIEVENRRLVSADVHAVTRQEPIFVSPVNVAEIHHGLSLVSDPAIRQQILATLRRLARKQQVHITAQTGAVFGRVAAELRRRGRSADFRINDVWLAAQANQRDFTLLTTNPKDFRDIPELKFVALTIP